MAIIFLSLFTIFSSVLVIFFSVTPLSSWLVILISITTALATTKIIKGSKLLNYSITQLPLIVYYLLLTVLVFLFYSHYRTYSSSPLVWNILPSWFLPVLFFLIVLSVVLILLIRKNKITENTKSQNHNNNGTMGQWDNPALTFKKATSYGLQATSILFPLILLILPTLFPLGTDYDTFVHRAAETTIVQQGSIQPRTFLYAGEYGIVSVLSTLTTIPVKTVNIYLLPVLVILFVPWLVKNRFKHPIVFITFFLLPFSLLTTTVPQGLGIFFLLMLLLFFWSKSLNVERGTWNTEITKTQNHNSTVIARTPQLRWTKQSPAVIPDAIGGQKNKKEQQTDPSSSTAIEDPETNNQNKKNSIKSFNFFLSFLDSSFRWNDNTLFALLAIASFISHPLPGLAAFVFLGFSVLPKALIHLKFKIKNLTLLRVGDYGLRLAYLTFSSLLIPLALYLNNYLPSQFSISSISFNPQAFETLKTIFNFGWVRYTDPVSFVRLFEKNYYILFFSVVIIFIAQSLRQQSTVNSQQKELSSSTMDNRHPGRLSDPENKKEKQKELKQQSSNGAMEQWSNYLPYLLSFLSLFLSSLIILFFLRPNVTSAEHVQLFTRVFSISLVFLWPMFLEGINLISQQSTINKQQNRILLTVSCLLLTALIVSNIYLQFPHSDRFEAHKGYLVSQDDLATVRKIEEISQKPYLVLGNQQMGAAALDQFGFAQYISQQSTVNSQQKDVTLSLPKGFNNEKQFFYSIPVSSKAQQYFLAMLKNPSQELVNEIFATYDIKELYVILNDYWKNSRLIYRELSKISVNTIPVGRNTIFQFSQSSD